MTDGRRRRLPALVLLVALTSLALAPAVAFADYGPAAGAKTLVTGSPTLSDGGTAISVPFQLTTAGVNGHFTVACSDISGAFVRQPSSFTYSQGTARFLGTGATTGTFTHDCQSYGAAAGVTIVGFTIWSDGATHYDGYWDLEPGPDTEPPAGLSVSIGPSGQDVVATWSGATDNVGVTGYRYRWDGSSTWLTWSFADPMLATDKTLAHSIEVQARDAAGNWSATASDTWGGCTVDEDEGCDGWGTGGTGDFGAGESGGDCPFVNSAPHCLDWSKDRPALADPAPNRWVFGVKDRGFAVATSSTYVVGWTCSGQEPVEGYASWRALQDRSFDVDCAEGESVGNFYVLGGGTLSEPDYEDVVLWWGYYRPGADVDGEWDGASGSVGDCSGPDSCTTYNYVQPAPTTAPHPSYTAPAPAPVDGVDTASAGCGFSLSDPSSWAGAAMCEVARLLRKVVDAVGSVLSFLRGIPGWFVPRTSVLQGHFGSVDAAWDGSAVGTLTGAVGDIAAPITGLEDTTTSCEGPLITMPGLGGSAGFTMHPFSACSSLAQYILGVVMPLERAFVYLAGFFVALRIVSRTVGLDGPDQSEARTA